MKILTRTASVLLALSLLPAISSADIIASGGGGSFPDNDPGGFSSTITVADNELISGLSISIVNLTHTWVGDLNVSLTAPDGTSMDIMFRTGDAQGDCCGDSSDLGATYTFADGGADWWAAAAGAGGADIIPGGVYAPTSILGAPTSFAGTFGGLTTAGDWTLLIADLAGGDLGSYSAWDLSIESTGIAVPEPGTLLLFSAGLLGLGLARRRRS